MYRVINSGFGVILVLISSISTVLLFVLPLLMLEKIGKKSFLSFFLLNPLSVHKKNPNQN